MIPRFKRIKNRNGQPYWYSITYGRLYYGVAPTKDLAMKDFKECLKELKRFHKRRLKSI